MEGANLWCEVKNCGSPAVVFGMKINQKIRSCEAHISQLVSKRMQIIDIAGYGFISSLQDAAVFEEREILVQKGRGNLAVLEANCESELIAAIASIQKMKSIVLKDVEGRFEEMKLAVTEACRETKIQFVQLKRDLEQLLLSKENQLPPATLLICSELKVMPRFLRFGIADVSDSVSTVLSDCWAVAKPDIDSTLKYLDETQKNSAIEAALEEAWENARRGILEALEYANSLIGTDESFEDDSFEILSELLEFEKKKIERNLKWLQYSWDLRQRHRLVDRVTIEVGQKLGMLLSRQLGKSSEAEQILQYCCDITQQESLLSEDSMSLRNTLCEVYFNSGQFERAEELCMWILDTFEGANLPAELYFITLFYLNHSTRFHEKREKEVLQFVADWIERYPQGESQFVEMTHLLESVDTTNDSCKTAAFFPHFDGPCTSHLNIICNFFRAKNSSESRKELGLSQSRTIFEVLAPMTVIAAMIECQYGDFLTLEGCMAGMEQDLSQMEDCFQRSEEDYSEEDYSQTEETYAQAEECYRQAQSIIEVVAPKSVIAANIYVGIGEILTHWVYENVETTKETAQALQYFEKAASIYAEIGNGDKESEAKSKIDELKNPDSYFF